MAAKRGAALYLPLRPGSCSRSRLVTLFSGRNNFASSTRAGLLAEHETLYPLEFLVTATPRSVQASKKSISRWKATVTAAARERARATDELGFLDRRPVGLVIYYFPSAPMAGDIDNIVKPIMDALVHVAYMNDQDVERVLSSSSSRRSTGVSRTPETSSLQRWIPLRPWCNPNR